VSCHHRYEPTYCVTMREQYCSCNVGMWYRLCHKWRAAAGCLHLEMPAGTKVIFTYMRFLKSTVRWRTSDILLRRRLDGQCHCHGLSNTEIHSAISHTSVVCCYADACRNIFIESTVACRTSVVCLWRHLQEQPRCYALIKLLNPQRHAIPQLSLCGSVSKHFFFMENPLK
jgi:hypothetical protein